MLHSRKGRFLQLGFLFLLTGIGFAGASKEESPVKKNLTWWQQQKEAKRSTVLLNNQTNAVPILNLEQKIASLSLGASQSILFDSLLNKYTTVTSLNGESLAKDTLTLGLAGYLAPYKKVIVQIPAEELQYLPNLSLLKRLQAQRKLLLAVYGKKELLPLADAIMAPMVWTEEESPASAHYVAQIFFGGTAAQAKLDRTYSQKYQQGLGATTQISRLTYGVPEELGINSSDLQQPIDAIVGEAIQQKATPGAVVMVVKDGTVIFNKAYGSHTYDNSEPTQVDDIFDLASLTKTSASTVALMQLYDHKKVDLNAPLGTYIPSVGQTNKASLKVKQVLLHESGLPAGVSLPVGAQDLQKSPSEQFSVQLADSLFLSKDYFKEVLWPRMVQSKLQTPGKYVYSDLTMYFMKEVIERQAKAPLQEYVQQEFYAPLGMQTAGYLPLLRFEKSRIVPTEKDTYFRKTLLQGYVHDGGAARVGGIAGHAGLFGTANDMAILHQMLLNKGSYGNQQYISPETVELFTSRQSSVSRRGLGFDRWDPDTSKHYPSQLASSQTYGHTGYTGTCVWVDPARNLVYIFLSNRVYPSVSNKLNTLKIRPRIQDAIYKALDKANPTADMGS
ncbi:serine hydrolase [Nibribacter ruber]|uniref:Serine hydrolase n=1 Tax=Nibribacter ruber TaxID=2698458 RepID=A0A6P1NZS3_9BACT|nr:serine hydrolase [Nibribacter ruber]QHL86493.1 serine hydrolase [Nibribacter ruber]